VNIGPKNTIRKRFIAAESDQLIIETIQTESLTHRQRLRLVKLKGIWFANAQNELCFEANLHKGPPQTYTFKGAWQVNKNQQIEYSFGAGANALVFKGHWDIPGAHRLAYLLEGSSTSRFVFKAQLESPSLVPKKGELRFRLGAGMRKSRLTGRSPLVILYGEWKFGRNLGLLFQMDYGRSRVKSIEFGAQVTLGSNKVDFLLNNKRGEPLGVRLTMTRKLLKSINAQVFIKLESNRNKREIAGGITIPF
jgi:hypothetical protein